MAAQAAALTARIAGLGVGRLAEVPSGPSGRARKARTRGRDFGSCQRPTGRRRLKGTRSRPIPTCCDPWPGKMRAYGTGCSGIRSRILKIGKLEIGN